MYLTFSTKSIRFHKVSFSIFLFLILFSLFHYVKPGFAYDTDGAIRPFGLGYRNKTVIPVWSIAIILAILSYLTILVISQS
jgi:hypothetical protein